MEKSILNFHFDYLHPSLTHTKERAFKCVHCRNSFGEAGTLKRRVLTHSGVKTYTCSECKKSFGRRGTLRNHMVTHTGKKVQKCAECGDSFPWPFILKTHMLTHSGKKPHNCTQSDFASSRAGNLIEITKKNTFLRKVKYMQMMQLLFNPKSTPYLTFAQPLWREATSL